MDTLKKIFPYSFGAEGIVLALAGLLTGWIPVLGAIIGALLSIVGWVVEVYVIVGIVLLCLDYFKVIK